MHRRQNAMDRGNKHEYYGLDTLQWRWRVMNRVIVRNARVWVLNEDRSTQHEIGVLNSKFIGV